MKNQNGNAILFVLVCIPLVLSFAILVVDVSRYQSLREQAQDFADQLVLQAAKYLPSTAAVQTYVQDKIKSQERYQIQNLEISVDRVDLTLESSVDSFFDVFLKAATGKQQSFTVSETASATVAPLELVIIMPDGLSMRPKIRQYWQDWPTSGYFNLVSTPQALEPTIVDENVWHEWWNDFGNYGRWATQSCFNPVYSAVKSFAVSLLDMYLSFNATRVSVISIPGDDPLLGHSLILSSNNEFADNQLSYWEQEHYLSDQLCALIAEQNDYYKTYSKSRCSEIVSNQTSKQVYYPRNVISDCVAQGNLSAQEAIYYRAARKYPVNQTNLFSALKAALAQIAAQPKSEILQRRANLITVAKKEVIVLIDTAYFDANSLLKFWQDSGAEQLQVRLNIIPFYSSEDANQIKALNLLIKALKDLNYSLFKVLDPVSPEALIEKILPEMMQTNQQILLRS